MSRSDNESSESEHEMTDEAGSCERPYCCYLRKAWSWARDECHLDDEATREAYTRRTGKVAPHPGDRETVRARTKAPKDYAFLSWVWEHFDDFCRCDGRLVLEEYTRQTSRPSPYENKNVAKERELCAKFWTELERGELPEIVSDMAYGSEELPSDDRVLDTIRGAVAWYYGQDYADGVLSRDERVREATRRADLDWSDKVAVSFLWKQRLLEDVQSSPDVVTTNIKQVSELFEEWSALTALQPNAVYDVVRGKDGGWVYDAPTFEWDEPRCLDALGEMIDEGYVVGVFVFNSEREASEMQQHRVLPGAPRGEREWVPRADYPVPSPRAGDD